MYVGADFDDIDPGAVDVFAFKFGVTLGAGENLLVPTFSLVVDMVLPGFALDASPASRLSGAAALDPSDASWAVQRMGGMLAGNRYIVQCLCTTDQGNTKSLWSHVTCRTPS